MTISEIENSWNVDLSAISNTGKTEKRFDFVIKTDNQIYVIETNFYASNGSKLNETARSYKTITKEVETIEGDTFEGDTFMWVTDGKEWESARNNLEEIFDILEHIYSINDLENGIIVSNKINWGVGENGKKNKNMGTWKFWTWKVKDFLIEMEKVALESYRVLKKDKFCAILMGDTRQKGHIVPMSFEVMKIFETVGFKTKEIIIKEQHNCRATGFWKTNSIKYNFLLIAHEYLFVFKK